jgi:hypothetical protein
MLVIAAAVVLALAWWWLRRSRGAAVAAAEGDRLDTVAGWPPQGTRILTSQERIAYGILTRALPGYMVLAKVPVSRFIKVPTRNSYTEWLRRLGNQCTDLVVCDMSSAMVAAVVVQAPAGQTSERSRKRLNRMAKVLKAADIPLHVWTEHALPSVDAARETILPGKALPSASLTTSPPAVQPSPVFERVTVPGGFDDAGRDSSQDEVIEVAEPPPSTWFDEFNSGPTPLQPPPAKR